MHPARRHFCRHDNPSGSDPFTIVRSLSAMLAVNVPGFESALAAVAQETKDTAQKLGEVFSAFLTTPLASMAVPTKPVVFVMDALDEIPRKEQAAVLSLLTQHFTKLPPWVLIFTTSRDEVHITKALSIFEPMELKVDEERNLQVPCVRGPPH
jgi:hypothetical protein